MKKRTTYSVHYCEGEELEEWDFGFEHDTPAEAINRAIEDGLLDRGCGDIVIRRHWPDDPPSR